MPKHYLFASVIAVLLVGHTLVVAQSASGDAARGQGSYLNGLGWYNLNTAKANSINVDATIRWKQDLRQIQLDRWDLVANQNAKKAAGKKLKIEEVKHQQLVRLRQLRIEPTAADVETGDALNVLLYDLTDPAISLESWSNTSQQVKLPDGMSVKDLVFRFTSLKGSSATSAALSKGVIALSRLAVAGDKWPTPLQVPEIQKERAAYEAAYAKVRDQILAGQFDLKAVQAMDRSLDALNEKVKTAVPSERGFRTEAAKFVSDLEDSTRMFDAATVDYAREILNDTKDHDATTVAELVAFMLKYRLQFASAERDPGAREIYTPLFEKLKEQHKAFGIQVPDVVVLSDAEMTAETLKAMQGTWICVSSEEGGTKFNAAAVKEQDRQVVIEGNNFALTRTYAGNRGTFVGKFEVNAKLGLFDFVGKGPGGKHQETTGIFEVNGDTLKLCYRHNVSGKAQRPEEFKSDGTQPDTSVFFEFKRAR